tara:strand:+ start:1951 stop:2850 length:900 start_codon:yes stop_codon:yes gene_type:complete
MVCPHCTSSYGRKKGIRGDKQRCVCYSCGKQYCYPLNEPPREPKKFAKILIFDIETSLMKVFVWGLYKQYIPPTNIIADWYVISWAAKWLYDETVFSDVLTPKESKNGDDARALKSMWKLLDEADIVIAHNGDKFDLRKLNWRFINNKMHPPTPYRSIDTLKIARKEFAAPSYKLDFLTKNFGMREKIKTDFGLWVKCMEGDKDSLDEMSTYNKQDVVALEDLYLKIRPYIKNHPNIGVLADMDICSNCGSEHIEETDSVYLTSANKFLVYRCRGCKTPYIRSKKHINQYKTNLRSVAR